jgi:hypothetical protein
MEAWEITVNPREGTLGLEGLRRREFTEYWLGCGRYRTGNGSDRIMDST